MGVPALFRLLSRKFHKVITPVVEAPTQTLPDGTEIGPDLSLPNPNGEECDNLYLDMNGIVHPCSHPEDRPAPETEDEMMIAIFEYTDRIMAMVRPRKLLYIAIDGVAPRAKMNQQRSRRFRSSREAAQKEAELEICIEEAKKQGIPVDEEATKKKAWDSNCITPGTPFMDTLAKSLKYYIINKLNTDPCWRNTRFILSDASVPGEGEHKIMEFIRSQRVKPEYDPNTRHVVYGLDADLIMLGLATHEPHFRVLREDVFFQQGSTKKSKEERLGLKRLDETSETNKVPVKKPFIWLHVSVLREYLEVELYVPNLPFPFDLERAIDDWVFFIFFVGNDFLPHLPSLDIRDGAVERLTEIWRTCLPHMGGYLTLDGSVNLTRAEMILTAVGDQEDDIFKRLKQQEDRRTENQKRRAQREANQNDSSYLDDTIIQRSAKVETSQTTTVPSVDTSGAEDTRPSKARKTDAPAPENLVNLSERTSNRSLSATNKNLINNRAANRLGLSNEAATTSSINKIAAANLKSQMTSNETLRAVPIEEVVSSPTPSATDDIASSDPSGLATPIEPAPVSAGMKRKAGDTADEEASTDTVRLHESGYRERYYEQKFGFSVTDTDQLGEAVRHYVHGLCWVLLYYYQGCPSWTWYYPYHYAPFAADFKNLSSIDVKFDVNQPFRPYEQLLGVLPAASRNNLPEKLQPLMTEADSEIIDFYPEDFVIDLNGKKFEWQGVALLPFIDENRLLSAVSRIYPSLSEDEARRNTSGSSLLFVSEHHPMYPEVVKHLYSKKKQGKPLKLSGKVGHGIFGKVSNDDSILPNVSVQCPVDVTTAEALQKYGNIENNQSLSLQFEVPKSNFVHKSMLLRGVKMPSRVLTPEDVSIVRAERNNAGRRNNGSFRGGGPRRGGYQGAQRSFYQSQNYSYNQQAYTGVTNGFAQTGIQPPWNNGSGFPRSANAYSARGGYGQQGYSYGNSQMNNRGNPYSYGYPPANGYNGKGAYR
ncbi:5'-3' exoribonuclease Dhp1 [Schizosaccharomyces octosporus yFS286]|uniref:5'-3' exoribonuclease n=1 Tax=Schizosaccharomyces octosporus (strain yFS286) TaxID=483514 RepID=S9PSN4_SCHOY|nr:5'-3' exoribonuclease Dhp1 [Schizosaccharomyces octosporus yFS286]EPX72136.1 5'-3' exoribonuclease Dhp1 [Schizosaccharomyces octosporus yFS286]